MNFDDLEFGLKEVGFELIRDKKKGVFEVRPSEKETPVYEMKNLNEVQHFFNGIEAQIQFGSTDKE